MCSLLYDHLLIGLVIGLGDLTTSISFQATSNLILVLLYLSVLLSKTTRHIDLNYSSCESKCKCNCASLVVGAKICLWFLNLMFTPLLQQ